MNSTQPTGGIRLQQLHAAGAGHRSRWSAAVSVTVALVLAGLTPYAAPDSPAQASQAGRATGTRSENQAGAELFATTCKVCHGEAGIGGVGPALRGTKFTRPYVRRAMSEGRPGSMMPEFTKTFTATQMNDVAAYVASLQTPASSEPAVGLRGDPATGEVV